MFAEVRANWQKFETTLIQLLSEQQDTLAHGTVDERAELLNRVTHKAAFASIPRKKMNEKIKPPWWTAELTHLRADLIKVARAKR